MRVPVSPHHHYHLLVCICLNFSCLTGCEGIPHCGLDLHLPNNKCWVSFHLYIFFWRNTCPNPLPVFQLGCLFLWVIRIRCIIWILTPYQIMICRYFLFCRLIFHFLGSFDEVCYIHIYIYFKKFIVCAFVTVRCCCLIQGHENLYLCFLLRVLQF